MKIKRLLIDSLLFAICEVAYSENITFPSQGTCAGGTITGNQVVSLTCDSAHPLTITGSVVIPNGASLTIRPNNSLRTINFGPNGRFRVQAGGTLIISLTDEVNTEEGRSTRIITLDAGANFTVNESYTESSGSDGGYRIIDKGYLTTTTTPRSNSLIENFGTLILNNVHILNYYSDATYGSVIAHDYNGNHPDASSIIKHCKIYQCKAQCGVAIFVMPCSDGICDVSDTEIYDIVETSSNTGMHEAAVRGYGDSHAHMNLSNVHIHHCYSAGDNAAIYWPVCARNGKDGKLATLTMDGCEIDHNYSTLKIGAVDVCGSFTLKEGGVETTRIHHNYSGGDAGGMALRPYNSGSPSDDKDLKITYNLTDKIEIFDNISAKNGGGLAVIADDTALKGKPSFTLSINGTKIYGNTSRTGQGGGLYLFKSASASTTDGGNYKYPYYFTLIKGDIYDNRAGLSADGSYNSTSNGGGIYLDGLTIVSEHGDGNTVNIYNNTSALNGGGFHINGGDYTMNDGVFYGNTSKSGSGGGIFINGNLTLNQGDIHSNTSDNSDGGGIYVASGNLTIGSPGAQVKINGNTAARNGGGAFINGGVTNFLTSTAYIESNDAVFGGGLYVNGGDIHFKGNIVSNTAVNGGGLYLGPEASMEFQGGLIINNQADTTKTTSVIRAKTAYHGGAGVPEWGGSVIEGCGGGIYLQSGTSSKKTTLTFNLDKNDKTFGLYTNRAQKAGDDIVSEGLNTEVTLPSVMEMQLYGFEGKDATPFWYQDYFYKDKGYDLDNGHAVENDVNYIGRFRQMIQEFTNEYYNHRIRDERLGTIKNNYLCLTLSYNMLDITISAKYLLGHETALFRLVRHGGTEDYKYDVLLRGDKTDSTTGKSSRTLRNMPWGTYSIFPNDAWNWAYDKIAPQQNLRLGETGNYEFVFDMNHINGAEVPQHDERQPVKPSGN